uniref:Uncharacterized protein n=3 Tax=Homininae TaxID=207598 RepID=A0A2I3SGZ4_PANTR
MAHNTIPQPVKGLPSSGSNLPLQHNWVSSPIWNLLQAYRYSPNLQAHRKFLPNLIMFVLDPLAQWLPNITRAG